MQLFILWKDLFVLLIFCLFVHTKCFEKVSVNVVAASRCPDTTSWEDEVGYNLLYYLHEIVDLRIDYLASYEKNDNNYKFTCMHGENECIGNRYQLCAQKYFQEDWLYLKFIGCMNENRYSIPNNVEDCANNLLMDWDTLESCYQTESALLFADSIDSVNTDYDSSWVPTIFINHDLYCEWHKANCPNDWTGFREKICFEYQGTLPYNCNQFSEFRSRAL
ncbi:gamma-interferon inducible lysosomal thiol reductase gilt [Anaeramoeba flamelloides]|uniref:Gamma-interferon inducible lysosomal thiol reductase gilt n=1 Tax=Anaeramoeba flamelloides TaxID=1746091 RepID=A0ABQ8XF48_9EUKA|nr:gamma-interferon inducible lysosomal thiol reductase gilt [Anaeramoeba flamelloides]